MSELDREKLLITADCVSDLPIDIVEQEGIELVYFYIKSQNGIFGDGYEVCADNVVECIERGERVVSVEPSIWEYHDFFAEKLKDYQSVIHLNISDKAAVSYKRALVARNMLGEEKERVHVIDTKQLSGGMGILVLTAARMCREGYNAKEIVAEVDKLKEQVVTSFISKDIEYLMMNRRVSRFAMYICRFTKAHPILQMKSGELKLIGLYYGNYRKCMQKYVHRIMKECEKIHPKRLLFVQAGCDGDEIQMIRDLTGRYDCYGTLVEAEASATVTANCGAHTFGLIYVNL